MSYWNYRVVKVEDELRIYSIYYDSEDKIVSFHLSPEIPTGSSIDELKTELMLMMEATEDDILIIEELSGKALA